MATQQAEQQREFHPWEYAIRTIYGQPASVTVVDGEWKTGKTDLALHLYEEAKRLGVILKCASNIMCWEDPQKLKPSTEVVYIDNFIDLNAWMFSGYRKMFIYDEAIKSTPSRRAMSQMNTKWLEVIPELSKGRMHLVVITQELKYTESSFLHPTFVRGHWRKISLPQRHPQFRKMVKLYTELFPEIYTFKSLPPTKIVFDPYRSATFSLTPDVSQSENLSLELKVAYDYARGMSTDAIVQKYKPDIRDRTSATRELRKGIKILIEKLQVTSLKRRYLETDSQQLQEEE
jgi:hypothetical protein